jgi:hypothetical protein
MSKIQAEAWIPVRKNSDGEWIDADSATTISREFAKAHALQQDKECGPTWAKGNPVVRIPKFLIQEL